ncbi:MAG: winged helix-turn-helix domain-containing protein [Burkholderiales bacterium]
MPRYPGLTLRVLGVGHPAMGPGRAALLSHIVRTGSITSAARAMGMSYRRAWQLVEAMNRSFAKPVVVTEVGGRRGGGAVVTALGKRLAGLYRSMENKASAAIAIDLKRFARHLRKSPGRRAGRGPRRVTPSGRASHLPAT